jgi:hypothetical protein
MNFFIERYVHLQLRERQAQLVTTFPILVLHPLHIQPHLIHPSSQPPYQRAPTHKPAHQTARTFPIRSETRLSTHTGAIKTAQRSFAHIVALGLRSYGLSQGRKQDVDLEEKGWGGVTVSMVLLQ